jgi:anti-sigma-K factor RskA
MNYGHPELRERLAAEYALGTLRGPARRRFERLLRGDVDLRALVQDWEMRVNVLAESAPAVVPPARMWAVIEQRLGHASTQPARLTQAASPARWWNRLGFWRPFGLAAAAAAVVLAVFAALRPPGLTEAQQATLDRRLAAMEGKLAAVEQAPARLGEMNERLARLESGTERLAQTPAQLTTLDQRLARLESGTESLARTPADIAALADRLAGIEGRLSLTAPPPSHVAVLLDKNSRPMMTADLDVKDGQLVLRLNIKPPRDFTDKALEVWMVPEGGAPRSLGLLPGEESGTTAVLVLPPEVVEALSAPKSALAVSLEPKGGSPSGAPTGPVLFSGGVVPIDL